MFFFLWKFLHFRNKTSLRLLLKDPLSAKPSWLFQDFLLGISAWPLAAPAALLIGQLCDLFVYLFSGIRVYEQVAVHELKAAFESPVLLVSTLLSILVFAPLVEEFLFRGLLQTWLKGCVGRKKAIIITALCFASIHFSTLQGIGNISLLLSLFILGCFLGFVYERQGSLLSSVALHMLFNGISTLQILS